MLHGVTCSADGTHLWDGGSRPASLVVAAALTLGHALLQQVGTASVDDAGVAEPRTGIWSRADVHTAVQYRVTPLLSASLGSVTSLELKQSQNECV